MNKDEIICMAKQAGFERLGHDDYDYVCYPDDILAFAELIVSAEREACARVCDDIHAKYKWPQDTAEKVASQWCADAIRARGQA